MSTTRILENYHDADTGKRITIDISCSYTSDILSIKDTATGETTYIQFNEFTALLAGLHRNNCLEYFLKQIGLNFNTTTS